MAARICRTICRSRELGVASRISCSRMRSATRCAEMRLPISEIGRSVRRGVDPPPSASIILA
eukprot:5426544-Pleurochrysis_carterae.AAC.1